MQILKSERGVSMPLALLLFLICATLAAVVLAASTATAGQATTLKESEQSYYAVTSAAKLFRDELNGQTIVIEQEKKGTSDPTMTIDGVSVNSTNVATLALLQQASYGMMGTPAAWGKVYGAGTPTLGVSSIAVSTDSSNASSAVAVTVTPKLTSEGIAFEFKQNAAGDDSYKLILTMTAYADEYEEDDGDTKTRTTTVTWYADELKRPESTTP